MATHSSKDLLAGTWCKDDIIMLLAGVRSLLVDWLAGLSVGRLVELGMVVEFVCVGLAGFSLAWLLGHVVACSLACLLP